jgi:hypothetical protein
MQLLLSRMRWVAAAAAALAPLLGSMLQLSLLNAAVPMLPLQHCDQLAC